MFMKLCPPFTLVLNVENAQNPARKHFEMTSTTVICKVYDEKI